MSDTCPGVALPRCENAQTCTCKPGTCDDKRSMKHKPIWVWEGGKMTDKVQCANCGQVSENKEQSA